MVGSTTREIASRVAPVDLELGYSLLDFTYAQPEYLATYGVLMKNFTQTIDKKWHGIARRCFNVKNSRQKKDTC